MKILIDLGDGYSKWLRHSRALGLAIKPVLEALVVIDQHFLRTHQVPHPYSGILRYQEEPNNGIEEFAPASVVYKRGWGDCDDLAPLLCAWYRNRGERAKIRVQWRRNKNGKLYHVLVRRADGSIEDPSRILGMGEG